jgi:hypothetical protein
MIDITLVDLAHSFGRERGAQDAVEKLDDLCGHEWQFVSRVQECGGGPRVVDHGAGDSNRLSIVNESGGGGLGIRKSCQRLDGGRVGRHRHQGALIAFAESFRNCDEIFAFCRSHHVVALLYTSNIRNGIAPLVMGFVWSCWRGSSDATVLPAAQRMFAWGVLLTGQRYRQWL